MLRMTLAKLTPLGWRTGIGEQQLPALLISGKLQERKK